MTDLPDYGTAMWQREVGTEVIFQDFPVSYMLKVAGFFSTATEARIESADYLIQLALDHAVFDDVKLLAPAETREMLRVWALMDDPSPCFFPKPFVVAFCAVLPTLPEGYDAQEMGKVPFLVRSVFPANRAPFFGTGSSLRTKVICFAEQAKTVPLRWLKHDAQPGTVVDAPRICEGGLIRVVSAGPGAVKPEIWDGTAWVPGGTLLEADQGQPADSDILERFGVPPESARSPSSVHDLDQRSFEKCDVPADGPELYSFSKRDHNLLEAAVALLKKVAGAETLRPAQLVSVAKLLHVFSQLPRVTPELEVAVSVIGPHHQFGEIETWHYWDVGIEGGRLFLASGGHFYQPSTGGDSFTTVTWEARPGEAGEFEDYRGTLRMVPDVETFENGVAGIDFRSGAWKIEITDFENSLLQDQEVG